jgi:hypothetical protein
MQAGPPDVTYILDYLEEICMQGITLFGNEDSGYELSN